MFFTTPAYHPTSTSTGYRRPRVSFALADHPTQYLATQRERAWALHYQQHRVNQPTPTALLAQEYNEFPDEQCIMRILDTHIPQDKEDISHMMTPNHTEIRHHTTCQTAEIQQDCLAALCARIEEEQGFGRLHADAEKFLAEAETYLDDTPVPTSTSKVPVQDELLLEDVNHDCFMTDPYFDIILSGNSQFLDELYSSLTCSPSPSDSARIEEVLDEIESLQNIGEVDVGAFFLCCEKLE
ncbi:hypothetical protein CY34DRAFT_797074 [Suillus luteus UH-Slu-Lm8-n1]|uniref:Uncharacterized protein n=1 Tax=Suillus luteus UH-Slu-Lm8-n1 TaxID=930992 RepID=A0A0D0C491_9AGAM|nr:hypothetical protein CY34DRAFT_797074 [Suillus luteus UH-Slu-Lm8-n1]